VNWISCGSIGCTYSGQDDSFNSRLVLYTSMTEYRVAVMHPRSRDLFVWLVKHGLDYSLEGNLVSFRVPEGRRTTEFHLLYRDICSLALKLEDLH